MAKFSIYSKNGQSIRHTGEPHFSGSYMGVDYIEFRTVSSPVPVTWEIGDYVDYYRTGLRYKLYSLPMPNKVARRGEYGASFEYSNVQLHAATKELEIAPFRDIVTEDNLVHFSTKQDFSTYEDVYGIARRIQACMDDLYPGRWDIRIVDTKDESLLALLEEVKEFSVSGASCLDALSYIYDTWKNVGWTHTFDSANNKDIVIIGQANVRTESNTSQAFEYGIGKGLTSIRKASANPEEFATRLYVYGSERNIQTRYYNQFDIKDKDSVDIRNLMLPLERWGKTNGLPDARHAYVQASDEIIAKYGLIPRTVYFDGSENDEIYPSIKGLTCSEVRQAMIDAGQQNSIYLPPNTTERIDKVKSAYGWADGSKEDIESLSYFYMHINPVGFDIAEQGKLTSDGHATISMTSGACAGREFVVKKFYLDKNNRPVLQIEKAWDDSIGESFPNDRYPISEDDIFVLLDIPMPDYYIALAEDKLYDAGMKMLADYTRVSAFYEPNIDPIVIKDSTKILRAGMYMKVVDNDIIETDDKTDYVLIDTLSIDESSQLPIYKVTLREQKRSYRSYGVLEEMIEDARLESKKDVASARQYTERRFRSAQETLSMLQAAFKNFSEGINPVTVKTMAMLVGDESLQFKFIAAEGNDMTSVEPNLTYDAETRRMKSTVDVRLMHMTLGIDDVAPVSSRTLEDYKHWPMPAQETTVIEEADSSYYIYAKVPKDGTSGEFVPSVAPIDMEEVEDFYHLMVGVLNSESGGERSFVPLYGFTEVLPGQITTNVIRSADGSCYFDLENNEIGGVIKFKEGSEGFENALGNMAIGGQNMLRNSGFTGDYLSERLADDIVLDATSQMYNNPLAYWTGSMKVAVNEDEQSESGYSATISNGVLTQQLYYKTIQGEKYVLSFKAKGVGQLALSAGGSSHSLSIESNEYKKYVISIESVSNTNDFAIGTSDTIVLCEIQLERGTVATTWSNSFLDNSSDRAYYEALKYLSDALKGSTVINGGLVLSSLIRLGLWQNGALVEKAGVNGLYEDDDTPAFWSGGSLEQAEELVSAYLENPSKELTEEQVASLAKFVLTHGGRAILNEAVIRGAIYAKEGNFGEGCTIGKSVRVIDGGIELDTKVEDVEGKINISEQNGFSSISKKFRIGIGGSGCSNVGIEAGVAGIANYCPSEEIPILAWGDRDKEAIRCATGSFGGLRTTSEYIDNVGNRVEPYISNILFPNSGTYEINLDDLNNAVLGRPMKGQELWLETMGATVAVSSSIDIFSHALGASQKSHSFARGIVRLKYYAPFDKNSKGIWTMSFISFMS